jgi:DNA-binding PadR family transcriptional regulator
MYPALESLETGGFITCQGDGRRKIYSLTSKGENLMDQVQKKQQEQFLEMKAFLSDIFDE